MKKSPVLLAAFLCLFSGLFSQDTLPIPRNLMSAYEKGTRSLSGAPGEKYWQNHAGYDIQVQFEPATRLITGAESIEYTNNSPDTLRSIHFKLYPNLYKSGSPRASYIAPEDIGDGVSIQKLVVAGKEQKTSRLRTRGTEMDVPVDPEGRVSSDGIALIDGVALDRSTDGDEPATLSAPLHLAAPVTVAPVPPSALYDLDRDSGCVTSGGEPHAVTVAGSQLGETFVVFARPMPAAIDLTPRGTPSCR